MRFGMGSFSHRYLCCLVFERYRRDHWIVVDVCAFSFFHDRRRRPSLVTRDVSCVV